jgi:two-component system LytT family response regulator
MIKVIIIDDEQHCIDRLVKQLIPSHEKLVEIIGSARSVEEGVKSITLLKPELVFLDVQLHEKTGFDLLRTLPEINFAIIFTTAYEKFAIQAIKFSAIDYLLKPIDEEDLNIALLKFINDTSKKITSEKINILLQNTQKNNGIPKKITVPTVSGFEFLDIANIIRCKSDINYTTIYLRDKQKLVVAKTLKEFEELLTGHSFFRIHNSHLINLAFIKSYNKGKGGFVILTDGTEIEVSTRRKDDFLKRLSAL